MAKDISTLALKGNYDDSDMALVRAMAGGEMEALNSLYTRHGATLLVYLTARLGDRQLAEEILQDVMLAAWNGAANFRGKSSVKTWLFAVARNQANNARTRRKPGPLPLEESFIPGESGPEQLLEQGMLGHELQEALFRLPEEQRETLELIFYHNLSRSEVAQVLKVAPGTIKSRLARARVNLRKLLKAKGEDE